MYVQCTFYNHLQNLHRYQSHFYATRKMNIVKSLVEGYAKINTATRFAKLMILVKIQFRQKYDFGAGRAPLMLFSWNREMALLPQHHFMSGDSHLL